MNFGSGKCTILNFQSQSFPTRVFPVRTSFSFVVQPMSPALSSSTFILLAPAHANNCASLSLLPLSELVKSSPSRTFPLITLKYCTPPICGSLQLPSHQQMVRHFRGIPLVVVLPYLLLHIHRKQGTFLVR